MADDKTVDKAAVREEYISGTSTVRQLAKKYGVSKTTIMSWAEKYGWRDALVQTQVQSLEKVVQTVTAKNVRVQTKVQDTAELLLDALVQSLDQMRSIKPLNARAMKDYSDALRSLQQVIDSKPTELDMAEQKARIAKLQKESMDTGSKAVTVRIEGCDDYAG